MDTKHYIFRSHKSHKFMMGLISFVVLVIGIMLGKNASILYVNDTDFKTFTVTLLFIINLVMIVLILIVAEFLIEVKDTVMESRRQVVAKESEIEKELKSKKK